MSENKREEKRGLLPLLLPMSRPGHLAVALTGPAALASRWLLARVGHAGHSKERERWNGGGFGGSGEVVGGDLEEKG